jgi:hypothetical protein
VINRGLFGRKMIYHAVPLVWCGLNVGCYFLYVNRLVKIIQGNMSYPQVCDAWCIARVTR